VLYLTDNHVSRAGSKRIADWVNAGGRLFATAGAGMRDELHQPNKIMADLLGVQQKAFELALEHITREKEHLPFANSFDIVTLKTNATEVKLDVFGAASRFTAQKDAFVMA